MLTVRTHKARFLENVSKIGVVMNGALSDDRYTKPSIIVGCICSRLIEHGVTIRF